MKKNYLEFVVGAFILFGLFSIIYISVNLGGLNLFQASGYHVYASFSSVAGLKRGGTVEIAGVRIGKVTDIILEEGAAKVTLEIKSDIKIEVDSLASVRTKGLIGEKFVKITLGGSDEFLESGDHIEDTEPVVEIEEMIGKFLYSSGDDSDDKKNSDE